MLCNLTQIKEVCEQNSIDYNKLINETYKVKKYNDDHYDFNFIVPVRGRQQFTKPLFKSVIESASLVDKKIQFTLFEHSYNKEHEDICNELNINYFHLHTDGVFNKCLSFNLSIILSQQSDWYIFHDLDCLVQRNFFSNLIINIEEKNAQAIQTFQGRRVLYLNQHLTDLIVSEQTSINSYDINTPGVTLPRMIGAPGGSIAIKRNIFNEVGGFDPEYFNSYAPEDIFMWDKIVCLTDVHLCDNPPNEIFHMKHPILHYTNPNFDVMKLLHIKYNALTHNKKLEFLEFKKNKFVYE
jgi:hypothetical protein